MEFTKAKMQVLRQQMQKALEDAGIEDVIFDVGNCTFSSGEASFKVKLLAQGGLTHEEETLQAYAGMFKLDLDKIVTIQGKQMKLFGYNSRARKMPYVIKDVATDTQYKITPEQAQKWFGLQKG